MDGSKTIKGSEVSGYPLLVQLERQLEESGIKKPFQYDVLLEQATPGDGALLVSFGGSGGIGGREYMLTLDTETGRAKYPLVRGGCSKMPAERQPNIRLEPAKAKELLRDLFGPLAEHRVYAKFSGSAKDYWNNNLKEFDLCNKHGSATPDNEISNVDIYGIAQVTGEKPEKVYERVKPLIEQYNRLIKASR